MAIVCEEKIIKEAQNNEPTTKFFKFNVDNKIRFWFYVASFENINNNFILDVRTEILMDNYKSFEFGIDVDDKKGTYNSTYIVAPSFVGIFDKAKNFTDKINILSDLCAKVDDFFLHFRFLNEELTNNPKAVF